MDRSRRGRRWCGSGVRCVARRDPITVEYCGDSFCKHPNSNAYHAVFCFKNTSSHTITIEFTDFVAGGQSATSILPATVEVPAFQTVCRYVDGLGFDNMSETSASLHFQFQYLGTTKTGSVTTPGGNQEVTPCGTSPREDQPKDKPPHNGMPAPCA